MHALITFQKHLKGGEYKIICCLFTTFYNPQMQQLRAAIIGKMAHSCSTALFTWGYTSWCSHSTCRTQLRGAQLRVVKTWLRVGQPIHFNGLPYPHKHRKKFQTLLCKITAHQFGACLNGQNLQCAGDIIKN